MMESSELTHLFIHRPEFGTCYIPSTMLRVGPSKLGKTQVIECGKNQKQRRVQGVREPG